MKRNFKSKGFTLIELLAIIVILAIIAVITVPIILNIIENSRKGAATDSALGFKDAVDKFYVSKLYEQGNSVLKLDGGYAITNGTMDIDGDGTFEEVPVSGTKASKGYLLYSNGVVTDGCLVIGDYEVRFLNGETSSTTRGSECPFELNVLEDVVNEDSEGNLLAQEDFYYNFEKYFSITAERDFERDLSADYTMTNSLIGSFTFKMGVETDAETGDSQVVTDYHFTNVNLNNILTYTYNGEPVSNANVQATLEGIIRNTAIESEPEFFIICLWYWDD